MNDLDFFRDQYLQEIDRSKFYDNVVPYPTTLLVVFVGGVVYSFTKYFECGFQPHYSLIDWIYISLLVLFTISTIITIIALFTVFHGFTRRYSYLPGIRAMRDHEKRIFKYFYKYSEKQTKIEKIEDAKMNACENIGNALKEYYIELAEVNQQINDKRAENYFFTRTLLFIDLTLFIPIAIIGLIK